MYQFNAQSFSGNPRSPYVAYLRDSSQPLTALIFLSPILLVYHFGIWQLSREQLHLVNAADLAVAKMLNFIFFAGLRVLEKISPTLADFDGWAVYLLRGGSSLFSLTLLMAVLLLQQHLASGRWRIRFYTLPLMAVECVAFALPALIMEWGRRWFVAPALAATVGDAPTTSRIVDLVMSTGAGVYEEFLFRGLLLPLLLILGNKFFGDGIYPKIAAILLQAIAFAGFHYLPAMNEIFHWGAFGFRLLAGIYFAYLWRERGFAIAAGSHVAYDILAIYATA